MPNEIKAFLGACVVMGLNSLPFTADYWSSDSFLGKEGIRKVMAKNGFENISQFVHFKYSSIEPRQGEDCYDCR